jgi:D-alanyl-lipoteichoic acid acyltransferase DltB (MBOAT superfamily)
VSEELAVTQIKGIKLLIWALLLKEVVLLGFTLGAFGTLGILPFRVAFEKFANGGNVSGLPGILSIIANFPEQMLMLTITGHVLVAIARFAGFRLLRNTFRPLSARTIAEFWNRYFYYFKELLANVYFYPTYVRCFKQHPRLRVAFATFMAAGVGNFLYHFMVNFANFDLAQLGFLEALKRAQTYAFYCLLLVVGIVVSQLRARMCSLAAELIGWIPKLQSKKLYGVNNCQQHWRKAEAAPAACSRSLSGKLLPM